MKLTIINVTVAVTPEWHSEFSGNRGGGDFVAEVWAVAEDGSLWMASRGDSEWTPVKLPPLEVKR